MKTFYLMCLTMTIYSMSFGQTVIITEKSTGTPIEYASVVSSKPILHVETNADGQADISEFKESSSLRIYAVGYKTIYSSYSELEQQDFKIELESSLKLDELVISATRSQQSSDHIPTKVITITPKEVTLQNPQTAADLLAISGQVYIQKSQQGGGSPMIRGFSTNRLLYSIDGVRMNNAIFRGGNLQNVISLDPFAIENTEVLFGPGSVMYGSDALGGVMSFETLKPHFSFTDEPMISGKAVTRYSSANNEKTGHFDINVGWKKFAMVTSVSSWDYDHLRQGSHGPDDYLKPYYVQRIDSTDVVITQDDPLLQVPSAYSQINLMQKFRYKVSKTLEVDYDFHYSETSPYGRYDRHNRIRNGTARYAEWNYGPQVWMMNNLSLTHHKRNRFYDQLVFRMAHQKFEESRIDRSLNSVNRSTNEENVTAYSANLDLVKRAGEINTLSYGAEFVLNQIESTGLSTDITTNESTVAAARYPNSNWQSAALYLNDLIEIGEKMTLQAGIRYNLYSIQAEFDTTFYPFPYTSANINNGALTGSIGTVFRPSENWQLAINAGTAFRSPNIDDIGKVFDSEPGAVTVPNPDLKAEYAYNIDLDIARKIGDVFKVDMTAYYTILNNAIVRRNYTLNGEDSIFYDGAMSQVQALQNAAVANIYGLQASMEMLLPGGFGFSATINYQVGEEELDDGTKSSSRHAAPTFGIARILYDHEKLSMQFYTEFQGERSANDMPVEEQGKDEIYAKDGNGENYAPSWYTLNYKAMYRINDMLTLSGGIENITDQRYRPYSSGISGAGRNFILSLKVNF